MGIDYKKMTSVELSTTIQNFIVKFTDDKGQQTMVHVERRYHENEIFGEEFEVIYSFIKDGEEDSLSPKEQNEVIEFVKSFLAEEAKKK
jgi:hypothetical protein